MTWLFAQADDGLFRLETTETFTEQALQAHNGLENLELLEFFKEELQQTYDISGREISRMRYYEYDLNSNGFVDMIVTIESPFYSGTAGNALYVFLRNEDNQLVQNSFLLLQIFGQSDDIEDAEFFVSNRPTSEFDYIIIKYCGAIQYTLVYSLDKRT
ncbi:MAG: hypothetical protein FWD35_05425 [Oscillospiraceae bacterium]|nr:hypothetical protein [Oscillospiraceae bacterium]